MLVIAIIIILISFFHWCSASHTLLHSQRTVDSSRELAIYFYSFFFYWTHVISQYLIKIFHSNMIDIFNARCSLSPHQYSLLPQLAQLTSTEAQECKGLKLSESRGSRANRSRPNFLVPPS